MRAAAVRPSRQPSGHENVRPARHAAERVPDVRGRLVEQVGRSRVRMTRCWIGCRSDHYSAASANEGVVQDSGGQPAWDSRKRFDGSRQGKLRRAATTWATCQRAPPCLKRRPITVLHTPSTKPLPMGRPRRSRSRRPSVGVGILPTNLTHTPRHPRRRRSLTVRKPRSSIASCCWIGRKEGRAVRLDESGGSTNPPDMNADLSQLDS